MNGDQLPATTAKVAGINNMLGSLFSHVKVIKRFMHGNDARTITHF